MVNKSPKCSTWMKSQKGQNDLFLFPRQTIQYHSNPSLCPNQWWWRSWSWTVLWRPTRVLSIHWKYWCWRWNFDTLATWYEELTHLKRPWCWARLRVGEEGDDREWHCWMASPTQWTWVWVNSGSWWWTGRPGVLQSQRVGHNWVTKLNWTDGKSMFNFVRYCQIVRHSDCTILYFQPQ